MQESLQAPPISARVVRARAYVELGRVSNLPTVWSNVLAGIILAGGQPTAAGFGALAVATSLLYVGGTFLNDAFDWRFDEKARPERPIPSGRVAVGEAHAIGFGLLAAGIAVLLLQALAPGGRGSLAPVLSGLGLAGAIVLYDAWHQHNPLSPLLMGLCRIGVYVTAGFAVSARPDGELLAGAFVLLAYLLGVTFLARQDDASKLRHLWPLGFLAAPLVYCSPALFGRPAWAALFVGFVGWVGHSVRRVRRGEAGPAGAQLIAGICLLDALLIAGARGGLVQVFLAVGCFGATLALQRLVKAT